MDDNEYLRQKEKIEAAKERGKKLTLNERTGEGDSLDDDAE